MKEKTLKNDCNILLKILADLQKYVYSKKGLKQRSQSPPTPPPSPSLPQSRRYFRAEKVTWLPLLFVI